MRLKEPLVKKHIHSWKATAVIDDFLQYKVERKCSDCGIVQHGIVSKLEELPMSLIHLADVEWRPGELDTEPEFRW